MDPGRPPSRSSSHGKTPSQQGSRSGRRIHPSSSVQRTPPRDSSAEFHGIVTQNAQLKEQNDKLQTDHHKLLAQDREIIEKLHADKRELNEENMATVKELTQSLTDLSNQNCTYQSQLHDANNELKRLRRERERLEKTLRSITRERDDVIQACKIEHDLLTKKADSFKIERDSLKHERDSLKHECDSIRHERDSLKQNASIHEHLPSLTDIQDEIRCLKSDKENLKQECEEESRKAVAMGHERESLVNEVTGLTAKNIELSNDVIQVVKTADELKSKFEYMEQNNIKLRQQIEDLMGKNQQLTLEKRVCREAEESRAILDEILGRYQRLQLELEGERKEKEKFALEIQEQRKQLAAIKSHYRSLEQEKETTSKQQEKTEQFDKDMMDRAREKISKKEEELRKMSLSVSDLLAEHVGGNNPFLEDLCSKNRSMKIAERFTTDLYGNEWCDALDALEHEGLSEKEAVEAICHTLVEVFEFCRDHFENVVRTASTWLVSLDSMGDNSQADIQVPGGSLRHLQNAMKDFLKARALSLTADKLLQLYYRDVADAGSDRVRTQQPLISFIKQALTICWCMATQDPPMSLHYQIQPGDAFEPTSFKPYRQPGSRVQSLVWPALLLTEGGHVMEKGVVMLADM